MTADILTTLIIISLGLFAGTGTGLLIGYGAKKQRPDWRAMTRSEIFANAALVIICSATFIALLAWYVS